MDCIIIDDETTARLVIRQLCSKVDNLHIVGEFPDAIQAIKYLNKNIVDLIFLDIHMPGLTGFDFIQTIKNPPKVVLTTSDPQFAIDAFEYDCIVDYLIKPIALPRFVKAVQKAENFMISSSASVSPTKQTEQKNEKESDLYVNIDRRLVKIDIPSILIVEAKGDYIQIKTASKNYVVHSTLKKIEDKLPENLFFKVHRSYVINTTKIVDIEDNSVLINKEVVPVSRANKSELIRRLNLL